MALSLVIPVAVEPVNPTLDLALESAARYAPWLTPVLVGEPVMLVEYADRHGALVVPFPGQQTGKPLENTTAMLRKVCELDEELISDPFVWSNDDIYFRRRVTLDDVAYEAAISKPSRLAADQRNTPYARAARASAAELSGRRRPTWNYERHVPLVVHKQQMLRALEIAPGGSPRSTYQNLRLESPALKAEDVKAFRPEQLDFVLEMDSAFWSSGNTFPSSRLTAAVRGS